MKFLLPSSMGLLGLMVLAGCHSNKPAVEEAPLVVSVAQLKPGKALAYEEFTGRTASISTVDIKARATGYLEKVLFTDGEEVKAGQLLYEIDPRTYAAFAKAAKGAVANAQASVELADADFERGRKLMPSGGISSEDYDTRAAKKHQASAQLISNQADLERAELNLGFCKVYAPISGQISRSNIREGNLVTADQTTLTTIVSMDPIYAYFDADEQTVLRVQQMTLEEVSDSGVSKAADYLRQRKLDEETVRQAVRILGLPLAGSKRGQLRELLEPKLGAWQWGELCAILDANPKLKSHRVTTVPVYLGTRIDKGYPHVGRVDFTDNRLDSTTGTLRVRGVFPNKERDTRSPTCLSASACRLASLRPPCWSATPSSSPTWTASSSSSSTTRTRWNSAPWCSAACPKGCASSRALSRRATGSSFPTSSASAPA